MATVVTVAVLLVFVVLDGQKGTGGCRDGTRLTGVIRRRESLMATSTKPDHWHSVFAVAQRLGMSESFVRNAIVSGRLRAVAYELGPGRKRTYRIREAWVLAFIREYRVGPDDITR